MRLFEAWTGGRGEVLQIEHLILAGYFMAFQQLSSIYDFLLCE